jgi:hypothetical protein
MTMATSSSRSSSSFAQRSGGGARVPRGKILRQLEVTFGHSVFREGQQQVRVLIFSLYHMTEYFTNLMLK